MLPVLLATVGGLAVGVALGSRPLRSWPVTEPLLALLLGVAIGPQLLDLVSIPVDEQVGLLRTVAELVLGVSLMSLALRYPLHEVLGHMRPVLVLVTAGLVGMTALTALGGLLAGLPLTAALVWAAAVAPTDPVLASSIVTGDLAEEQLPLRVRAVISLESGVNDGLAIVFVILAFAAHTADSLGGAALEALLAVVVAVVLGAAIGWLVGRVFVFADRHRDIEHTAFLVLALAFTAVVLGVVALAKGSTALGVLAAGLAFAQGLSPGERREEHEIQEAVNQYLVLPAFTLLGVTLPWAQWGELGLAGIAPVIGVLALRRLPVVLALRPWLDLRRVEGVFVGWFGPIGVAALFYLADGREQGAVGETVWALGTLLIAASTLVHGLTAAPGRRLLAGRLEQAP